MVGLFSFLFALCSLEVGPNHLKKKERGGRVKGGGGTDVLCQEASDTGMIYVLSVAVRKAIYSKQNAAIQRVCTRPAQAVLFSKMIVSFITSAA